MSEKQQAPKDRNVPHWYDASERPIDNVPSDIAAILESVQERSGFLPNIYRALAHRPDEFRAFFAYHDALMRSPSGLSHAEKELIVVSTSARNQCLYCVIAHGAILRIRSGKAHLADQVSVDPSSAGLSNREEAILTYAHKVSQHANTVEPSDFRPLYDVGCDDNDIWIIGSIAAFFALSNRLVGFAKVMPNPEFYDLGRS
ncbi:MAG: peroxidase-related enzyme [Acidimicrobiales bacterium]